MNSFGLAAFAEDRQRSREAGFDGHLVKPVDYDALLKLLAEQEAAKKEGIGNEPKRQIYYRP